jgi:hypothetical protein
LSASTSSVGRIDGRTVGLIALLAIGSASHLSGQAGINQFSYDNLRPSAVQLDLGMLSASQLEGTTVAGLRLDYGNIAPKVRLLLGISYFRAQLDQETTTRFEQRIRDIVIDPSGDDTITVGDILWSAVVFDMDFQYAIPQGKRIMTYIGAGIGIQLRNGNGAAIDGTFVDDALDQLAAAGNISIGVEGRVSGRWHITGDVRGVLSVGLATISARAGVMYRWGGGAGGGGAEQR